MLTTLTIPTNDHGLIASVSCIQNQNSISKRWCSCSRGCWCRHSWSSCCFWAWKPITWASSWAILLNNNFQFALWIIRFNLAGTLRLSCLELVETISFATLISFTVINASSKSRSILVDASVPLIILFLLLKWKYSCLSKRSTFQLTTQSQTGFAQSSQPSWQFNSQGQAKNKW